MTILQFRENLPDRQAAEAVRGRIDWKYLLGLELTDAGFDFSVLSEFRGLQRARHLQSTEAGRQLYNARAGIEGTISQGVRGFGLRQSRYWGLAKTHLQHLATAAAINMDRLGAWFEERPLAKTRVSRFARLAPLAT